MAGQFPDSFIETLNDRVNIVDVISARVPLKNQDAVPWKVSFSTIHRPHFLLT